ncbi:MAG: Hpt domain-containing protein [Deltaproteobacteria bacterium]|nr:Hpt domain-containing protein [Deltaproteobacteria bacterium]
MTIQDDETLRLYVEESLEHLGNLENDILAIEEGGADIDEELVNKVFRAAHSIKGGAGFMGLNNIKELSHRMENILGMIRSRELIPNPKITNVLLSGLDLLREMMADVGNSEEWDISEQLEALEKITADEEDREGAESTVLRYRMNHPQRRSPWRKREPLPASSRLPHQAVRQCST